MLTRILDSVKQISCVRALVALTTGREAARAQPWSVTDAPADYIEAQKKAVVGIEIKMAALGGKWKLSQNQPVASSGSF